MYNRYHCVVIAATTPAFLHEIYHGSNHSILNRNSKPLIDFIFVYNTSFFRLADLLVEWICSLIKSYWCYCFWFEWCLFTLVHFMYLRSGLFFSERYTFFVCLLRLILVVMRQYFFLRWVPIWNFHFHFL